VTIEAADGGRPAVTVIVLTRNEELNLAACLESVAWAERVFVVDSGSTDRTTEIARTRGAGVEVHPFDTHARQWTWALEALPIATEWVLGLDADQRVTPELRDEIRRTLGNAGEEVSGYFVKRRQVFRGRWIRHGGYYPKYLLKLFRRSRVRLDPTDLVDHHFTVDGPVRRLQHDIVEDNRNEDRIADWTAKHNRYAVLQAAQEFSAADGERPPFVWIVGSPDDRTRWLKAQWARLPLFVRPCVYVFYRYVVRLGFLDGKQGFVFHVLHAFWYRLLVDVNLDELRSAAAGATPTSVAPPECGR
jgi:glycosyltransferase involved in cell wall biosynthesis